MNSSHVSDDLAALLEGQLASDKAARVRGHIAGCERCSADLDEVTFGLTMVRRLPVVAAPPDLWRSIEAALSEPTPSRALRITGWRLAWAAALLVAIATGILSLTRLPGERWEVTRLAGDAALGSRPLAGTGRAGAGAEITTGESGRVRIRIGEIGTVVVEPNTQVRLAALGTQDHRLALTSGSLSASITAPPRLFFVETPSATAIDLGCEYTLECDRAGNGLLAVTAGWVALEQKGRESLVPAGASCRTRSGLGPGTPFFRDAPPLLLDALDAFDSGRGGDAVEVMLRESRVRDTLSLWHLLSRVAPGQRDAVYRRIAALAPPPEEVSLDRVLRLDAAALTKWKEELAWTW
jgi:anti-sigma factor RsiW